MKMRRGVIIIEHSDDDTKETTKFRHSSPLRAVRCRRRIRFLSSESTPHFRGRQYWLDVLGKQGWKARYVKEVDADAGKLVEVHHKYPVDHGHQKVTS
jgi:hypothetical protein